MPKTTNQKEKIVEAAIKLFATQGYGSTTVRQIAARAKVSYTLLYIFYKNKEELLAEIVNRGFEDIRTSMEIYNNKGISPRKALELHVTKTFEIIREHGEFWRLLHSIRLQNKVLEASIEPFREIIQYITSTLAGIFKKLRYKKPELEAILFLSQIDGLAILYLQDPSIPIKKLSQQLISRYK